MSTLSAFKFLLTYTLPCPLHDNGFPHDNFVHVYNIFDCISPLSHSVISYQLLLILLSSRPLMLYVFSSFFKKYFIFYCNKSFFRVVYRNMSLFARTWAVNQRLYLWKVIFCPVLYLYYTQMTLPTLLRG